MIQIKRILCPTDLSETSLSALPYAVEAARLFEAQIFVIHIVPPLPSIAEGSGVFIQPPLAYMDYLRSEADRQIDQIMLERIPKEIQASKVLTDGEAAHGIIQAAENLQIDLITIATHGRTGLRHLALGSVAEKVIRMSKVPVLTIRGDSATNR